MIVGAPRSGNTLVRRVLLASGQIYIPPETYVLGDIIENWRRWFLLPWRDKVWLFCAYFDRHPHRHELDVGTLSGFADDSCTWPRSKQNLRALLEAFYLFLATEHGYAATRWGDKTPWNTMHLKSITRFFPDARYLYLIRDGRDSISSQVQAEMRDLNEAARRWVSANDMCAKYLPQSRTLSMRYEDIVRDPGPSFARIFDWAELSYQDRYLSEVPARLGDVTLRAHHAGVLQPITPASIGGWRKKLSQDQINMLPPRFHEMLARLGYE
jgi:hypothetical protein